MVMKTVEKPAANLRLVKASSAAPFAETKLGGKGEGLTRLLDAEAKVPPFFVLDAQWLAHTLDQAGLLSETLRDYDELARESSRGEQARAAVIRDAMVERINGVVLPGALARELDEGLLRLGNGPFAVRSSMVGEDSASHSFAGQLESFLFRRSRAEVEAAVRGCWLSAFSERLTTYRINAGHSGLPAVGVVVQVMVDGEVSGVCFSADPNTGRRDRLLLSAGLGLGEGIVSGTCNTDEFELDPEGNELSARLADKDLEIVRGEDGFGTAERQVSEPRRSARALSKDQTALIARECARIATRFGRPQDIEWTLRNGELFILQSRPITNLKAEPNRDGPRVLFDNSNIQESYCGVTTPMTYSFAMRGYSSVYVQAFGLFGVPKKQLAESAVVFSNLLGLVRGRVYYNLNNWYRMLLLLPSFKRNKADMEKMMGVTEPVDFVEDLKLTFRQKLRRVPLLASTLIGVMWALRKVDEESVKWMARFDEIVGRIDRKALLHTSYSRLMEIKRTAEHDLLGHWATPIVNDLYVMTATGKVRRLIERAGFPEVERTGLASAMLGGEEGIESTEPTRELMRIAALVRADAEATALVRNGDRTTLLGEFSRFPEIHARIVRYIERYGDRVMGELKLESISLHEDPSFVFDVVRGYLDRPDLDAGKLAAGERSRREEAEAKLLARLPFYKRSAAKKALQQARDAVKNRENMRLRRTRAFGLYRDIVRGIGQRLFEAGKLVAPRDVFYLTVEELEAYHDGRAVSAELAPIAAARKAEFKSYEAIDLPHRFETLGPVYHGNTLAGPESTGDDDGDVLMGIGCSHGVVESEARVILNAQDELSVNGKILVTIRTDPGWAPLFPTCSGVLVERGSMLSHSAVVARELGIPAVVGVPNLLARVKDGQPIRLDGNSGRVEILQGES
jgi:phosphohistidine swiveling domain-containing protein